MPQRTASPAPRRDVVAVAAAIVLPSVVTWLYFFEAERFAPSVQATVFGAAKVVQFAFPVVWVTLVARRRLSVRWPGWKGVPAGAAFGALVAAAMGGLYYWWLRDSAGFAAPAEAIRAKVAGFGLDAAWKFAALGVFYSLAHSLLEEYYWRWFVFGELLRTTSLNVAVIVSSLGFMAHHVLVLGKYFGFANWQTWAFALCVATGGAVWARLYHRTGSLLGPWVSHLIVDAAIFSLGYQIARNQLVG